MGKGQKSRKSNMPLNKINQPKNQGKVSTIVKRPPRHQGR